MSLITVQSLTDTMTTSELGKFAFSVVTKYGLRVDSDMRPIKRAVDTFEFHQRQIREALDALERENSEQTSA